MISADKRADLVLPLPGQELKIVPGIDEGYVPYTEYTSTTDPGQATIITSQVAGKPRRHKVILDVDIPAQLIPSTTPGHFHLYIDHELDEDVYFRLLDALADAGVIEDGYRGASQARGFTAARLPWVPKVARKPEPWEEAVT